MPSADHPNVLLILADDMGYSDLGCYGGEIRTPHLDALGRGGVRFTQFYNTARCSPSRASLLTGMHPHQTGIGILAKDDRPGGYAGSLDEQCATMAETFRAAGYRTGLSGKWHLSAEVNEPSPSWPSRRGFDHVFGTITGCGSYYQPGTLVRGEEPADDEFRTNRDWHLTDAIGSDAVDFVGAEDDRPFFLYLAFTAPHWPLHARDDDVARYDGVYRGGWEHHRRERHARMIEEGILPAGSGLSPADPENGVTWENAPDQAWEQLRMQTYAAMVEQMDAQVGRVIDRLRDTGRYEDTVIVFLSDNGGCAEHLPHGDPDVFRQRTDIFPQRTRDGREVRLGNYPAMTPGTEDSYMSYGQSWANLSNTPFRFYKRWVHEGGISTPLIVHWKSGIDTPRITRIPGQLTDVLPTLLELTGVEKHEGQQIIAPGRSLVPALHGSDMPDVPLFWEHIGNAAVRLGSRKLVKETHGSWELYDVETDRGEQHNLADQEPAVVQDLRGLWEEWAESVGVIPWQTTVALYESRGLGELEAFS